MENTEELQISMEMMSKTLASIGRCNTLTSTDKIKLKEAGIVSIERPKNEWFDRWNMNYVEPIKRN